MLVRDLASIPLAATRERSLESLLNEADEQFMTVHLPYLCVDAVVLGDGDRRGDVLLLLDGGGVTSLFATVIAERIEDLSRQASLLRQAVAHEHEQAQTVRARLNAATSSTAGVLADIRGYVIAEYRAGHLERARLDAFLRTFDLRPFAAQQRVTFTITGTYLVDNDDTDAIYTDGHANLSATFTGLDAFVRGSDISRIVIDSVTPAQ